MNLVISTTAVRDYLELNTPGTSSKYSDDTIGSNIRAAQSYLEAECNRYFHDHPGVTYAATTLLRAVVPVPGFRSITSATWGGTSLSVAIPGDGNTSPSAWGLWEETPGVNDGYRLVTAIQFRPWRADNDRPWWLSDSGWFDKALDSPFYPGNYGGGYAWTSMPNDLVIVGNGGYAAGTEPESYLHTVKMLAAFYTMRGPSVMANLSLTPGGSLAYGEIPFEVSEFVADWKIGSQAQSVG